MRIAFNIPCGETYCGRCRFHGVVHTFFQDNGHAKTRRRCTLFDADCFDESGKFTKRRFRRCRACFSAEDRAECGVP